MSFEPDNVEHEATVKELLEYNNLLLKAVIILLCDQQDTDPRLILEDAEHI